MNIETSDWISLVLTITGLVLCIYISLDGLGFFKKIAQDREEAKNKRLKEASNKEKKNT